MMDQLYAYLVCLSPLYLDHCCWQPICGPSPPSSSSSYWACPALGLRSSSEKSSRGAVSSVCSRSSGLAVRYWKASLRSFACALSRKLLGGKTTLNSRCRLPQDMGSLQKAMPNFLTVLSSLFYRTSPGAVAIRYSLPSRWRIVVVTPVSAYSRVISLWWIRSAPLLSKIS